MRERNIMKEEMELFVVAVKQAGMQQHQQAVVSWLELGETQ